VHEEIHFDEYIYYNNFINTVFIVQEQVKTFIRVLISVAYHFAIVICEGGIFLANDKLSC